MLTFRLEQFLLLPLIALLMLVAVQSVEASAYRCANGTIVSNESQCANRGGLALDDICGNSYIETGEQCDDGSQNTDTQPNGCRNDCRRAYCGDGVVDSGEQCDGDDKKGAICSDFDKNGNINYNNPNPYYWGGSLTCRNDCNLDLSACHYCGDGVTQSPHEQCDDANNADDDGCNNNCTACVALNNNLDISSDTEICTQNYNADDYGDLGTIIIKAPNLVLDCDGARLTGQGDGIGIYIKRSDNVTVKNCIVDNYEFGIYAEDSDNIQIYGMGNKIYNSVDQVVLDNSTAQPAPQPTAQQVDHGLNPNIQALMRQKLQAKHVSSKTGDSLKIRATPGTLSSPAGSSTPRTETDLMHDAKPVQQPRPKRVSSAALPTITFPKSGQRFIAPARVTVKVRFDRKHKVTYLLRGLPGKGVVKRSTNPTFNGLVAGNYCVAVAYAEKDEASSSCVKFSVEEHKQLNVPVRQSPPLRRPL